MNVFHEGRYTLYRHDGRVRFVFTDPDGEKVVFDFAVGDMIRLAQDFTVTARVPLWRRVWWRYRPACPQRVEETP